jgi:phage-related protein
MLILSNLNLGLGTAPVVVSTVINMPYPNRVEIGSSRTYNRRTLKAQFGDGYGQFADNGLNAKFETWDIMLAPLTIAERNTAMTSLDMIGGFGTLLWTPCNDSTQKKYRVVDGTIDEESLGNGLYKLSFKLEQRFDNVD